MRTRGDYLSNSHRASECGRWPDAADLRFDHWSGATFVAMLLATLGPTSSFALGSVLILLGVAFSACAINPRWRGWARRGDYADASPVGALGFAAWALNSFLWATAVVAHGLQYEPIASRTTWRILGGVLALVVLPLFGNGKS